MDIAQLNAEFEGIRRPLQSFLLRMTASLADAEDIIQDTYIKASEKLNTFKGESSLKTWLFAISTNLAKDNLRAQKRWVEHVTDIAKDAALTDARFMQEALHINATSPHGHFEIKEHVAFCFTCIAKSLPLEQQLCLLLKEVYGFKVEEVALIINQTVDMVKYYLYHARQKMIEIFDHRCALINKEGVCHQCTELNGIFNPLQNAQHEKMKLQLAKDAEKGDKEHLLNLRAQLVSTVDVFDSPAADLELHHLDFNRRLMENYL